MSIRRALQTVTAMVTAGIILSGCSAPQSHDNSTTIGVSVPENSTVISRGQQGILAYADANDVTVQWADAGGDPSTQAQDLDHYLNTAVDAIVLSPLQPESLNPQIAAAATANIPVIAINPPVESPAVTATIVLDNVAAGSAAMQMMADHLEGVGTVLILQGSPNDPMAQDRSEGIEKVLNSQPQLSALPIETARWNRTLAQAVVSRVLESGESFDGVVAQDDEMALGALQALNAADQVKPIVGIGGTAEGLQAVVDGALIGTLLQHSRMEYAFGLALAVKAANGEAIEAEYRYTLPAVTSENAHRALANSVTETDSFLDQLPRLIDRNVKTGNLAHEDWR